MRTAVPIYRAQLNYKIYLLCIGEGEVLQSSGDTAFSEGCESWDMIFCGGGGGLCSEDLVCVA